MNVSDLSNQRNEFLQAPKPRSTEENSGIRYDNDFFRIEELIKGSTFSRENINYFMEILGSKVDNELEKQKSSTDAGLDTQLVSGTPEIRKSPSNEKQLDFGRTPIGTSGVKLNVPDGVSASPIDIARAYMAVRTGEGSHGLSTTTSNGERSQLRNEFARTPLLPSPPKPPSVCWPGAMVHGRHGYATPQSQRDRQRLHDFPRTPYSRTMLSKSKTKLQAVSGYENTPTQLPPPQTSFYGQVKSKDDKIDGYGSVGAIRRIRNKFSSEVRPRGSMLGPPKANPLKTVEPAVGRFLPSTGRSLELVETSGASKYLSAHNISDSYERAISNPDLSSSQAIRKILEHLDRTKPTPKEKEAELKLATAWRTSSSEATRDENISSVHVEELASHKNTDIASANFPVGLNKSSSKSNFLLNLQDEVMEEATNSANGNAKASSSNFTGSGVNALPVFGLKGTPGPVAQSLNENAFATTNHGQAQTSLLFPRPQLSNGQGVKMVAKTTGSEHSKNNGNKPSLPSISINKPVFRAISSESGPGFTFPVSASSGVLSEPPTPSITPSFSPSVASQPIALPAVPSYTFGTKKSTPPLVFSFPSTSSTSNQDDSDLKFSFASDNKSRLSFSSFSKDAICF